VWLQSGLDLPLDFNMVMVIIAPNSRARKGKKERREVKGEYGGI